MLGVYGLSALLLLARGALLALLRGTRRVRLLATALLLLPWPLGAALSASTGRSRGSAGERRDPAGRGAAGSEVAGRQRRADRELYTRLNEQALGAQLIVWPEAALPELANEMPRYLGSSIRRRALRGSDIVMGILRADDERSTTTTRC